MARNLFSTKTAIGVYIMVLPTLTSAAIRYFPGAGQDLKDISDIASKILMVAGGAKALSGRYQATDDVYTPNGLPGRSKDDIEPSALPPAVDR